MSGEVYQQAIFSLNPLTGQPYDANSIQVADGQGTRRWQDVFQTISSQSGLIGGNIGYLPSSYNRIYGMASSLSTIIATSYSTLSTMIGRGGIPGSITGYELQSTVRWVQQDSKYISTGDLVSSMTPLLSGSLSFMANIQSTVQGLGSMRYISSPSLISTTTGTNRQLLSTVTGLGSYGYISTLSLQSTIDNLGSAKYISSSALISSMTGLLYPPTSQGGSLGVVVTGTADPPFINFNNALGDYLTSTAYISNSNADSYGFVFGSQLPSTTLGLISSLGSIGYVSTQALLSTTKGILDAKQNIYINRTGATSIFKSQVVIQSVSAIVFLSSFVNSTIPYVGLSGDITGTTVDETDMNFSTMNLQLDAFSSFITDQSRITIEVYPTIQFDSLMTGSLTSLSIPMTTYLQYKDTWLSTTYQTRVVATNSQDGYSNYFQQPIKMSLNGADIIGNYDEPYVFYHSMPGSISYITSEGFRSPGMNVFFAPTNSYFISVQNLSF